MAKFRRITQIIDATKWSKNGDHPKDESKWIYPDELPQPTEITEPFLTEGKVVRYYRNPKVDGELMCSNCDFKMHDHGWIDNSEGGHTVCPGDWIIENEKGKVYPLKPEEFVENYEPATSL